MPKLRTFEENKSGWLVTFADMVTLLLALFVLLFSMSSLDSSVIRSISSSLSRDLPKRDLDRGKLKNEIRMAAQLLSDTGQVHSHEGRIKDLLFPRDLLPPGIDKGTLDSSFRIVETGRGIVFVLGDNILFSGEGSRVSSAGREILDSMAELFELMPGDVRITAFYAGEPDPGQPDDYASASRHALAALGVFINQGLDKERLSISAYGRDRASVERAVPDAPLSRVEVLLKTGKTAFGQMGE